MDQHEKDWLELGQQLRSYEPEGDPAGDFLAMQELQKKKKKRRSLIDFFLENLGALALLLLFGWIGLGVFQYELDRKEQKRALGAENELVRTEPAVQVATQGLRVDTGQETLAAVTSPEVPGRTTVIKIQDPNSPSLARVGAVSANAQPVALQESFPTINNAPGPTTSLPMVVALPSAVTTTTASSTEIREVRLLPAVTPLDRELPDYLELTSPPLPQEPAAVTVHAQPALKFTLGTGLSNHWRGANFWQEVDRGMYAYIGLERRIGQRLGLEGRIGYRGHGMRLPVFSDTDKPWSYYKNEVHSPDHNGTIQAYTYEGVVKGYRAVEFSLLANYTLSNRWQLTAGGRYSLPALEFHRTVHGPDDQNPFHDFIEGNELVKYVDYGALLGANYQFSRHLLLETSLHLGMVDLINNTAEGRERFNHSSSISIGLKYVLE